MREMNTKMLLSTQQQILNVGLRIATDIVNGRPFTRIYLNPIYEFTRRQMIKMLAAESDKPIPTSEEMITMSQNLIGQSDSSQK